MRIYLDNCCYNRPYDDQLQMRIHLDTEAKLHIQDMVKNNELELVTSYMLDYENAKSVLKSQFRIWVNANKRSTLGLFVPLSTLLKVLVLISTPSNCSLATMSAFLRLCCILSFLMFVPTKLLVR